MGMEYKIDYGKIVALIPARGGSKGVPRKNIRNLKGFPLIAYTIACCFLSRHIERIIVSTDDHEIAIIAQRYGAEVPFLRPAEMAADRSPDLEFVLHAINWFSEYEGTVPEYLVHMRPTTPLRKPAIVDDAIGMFLSDTSYSSLRSAHVAPESPFKWFLKNNENCFEPLKRDLTNDEANSGRELFQDVFIPDGYVDVLRSEHILRCGNLHGERMMAYISPFCTEVDTPAEFEYLGYEIENNKWELYEYLKENYKMEADA